MCLSSFSIDLFSHSVDHTLNGIKEALYSHFAVFRRPEGQVICRALWCRRGCSLLYRSLGFPHCLLCLFVNLTSVELSPTLGLTCATLEGSLQILLLSPLSIIFKAAWRDGWKMMRGKAQPANLLHPKGEPSPACQYLEGSPRALKLHLVSFTCSWLCSQLGRSCVLGVHSHSLCTGPNKLLLAPAKGHY